MAFGLQESTPQAVTASSGNALIRIESTKTLEAKQEALLASEKAAEAKKAELSGLAAYIDGIWQDSLRYKQENLIDEEMIANLEQRNNTYSPDKLQAIMQNGGADVFMSLTNVKCRAAEALIANVYTSVTDKPWSIEPTPIADLPEEVKSMIIGATLQEYQIRQQNQMDMTPFEVFHFAQSLKDQMHINLQNEAVDRADKMEVLIDDQLVEGGFEDAFDDFLSDLVTLKAGIIKGPFVRMKKVLKWVQDASGKSVEEVKEVPTICYQRISPFDAFPSRGAVTPNDGEFIERCRFTRKSLIECKGVPGYDSDAIDLVLKEFGASGFRQTVATDSRREELELKGSNVSVAKNQIEGLEFWGSVQGQLLIDRKIEKDDKGKELDTLGEYEVNSIKIGSHIIYLRFNPDPVGKRPYHKSGYAKIPGSFWFKGVPDLMRDLQSICNAAARALVNNMGAASFPQVVIEDINRIAQGEDISSITAGKIWQLVAARNNATSGNGITFHDIPMHAVELLNIYQEFAKLADDYTGIPAYAYGNERVSGAARTKGGLAMLMDNASNGIRKVVIRIDKDVMHPVLEMQYNWNMLYSDDDDIKGDAQVKPIGTLGLIMRDQLVDKQQDFLLASANPVDAQIITPDKRRNVWAEIAKGLKMHEDDVVPSAKEFKDRMQMAAQNTQQQEQAQLPEPAQNSKEQV
jgi:hypothetical protein